MVPCGTCPACRFNKSILSQNKVHAQSLASRYVYFVTLTYAQRYIPYYEYEIEALDADFLRLLLIVVIVILCIVLIRIVVPSIS